MMDGHWPRWWAGVVVGETGFGVAMWCSAALRAVDARLFTVSSSITEHAGQPDRPWRPASRAAAERGSHGPRSCRFRFCLLNPTV